MDWTALTWQDVADILLISVLIHRLLLLFRGTAVATVLAVIVALAALQWIAMAAGLALTHRVIQAIIPVAVLVVVVAFRDELRDALRQINPLRLILGRPQRPDRSIPRALAEVANRLAAERVGALIVLQNHDRLAERVREGVLLSGRISPQILESIFCKESPVHDGAVIIRGSRIERVGAFLPLTTRAGLPPEYGTRHRAAIGLSERTDAVVVVVSEERGAVAAVYRGDVWEAESPEVLENLLRRHWLGEALHGERELWGVELRRQLLSFIAVLALVALGWWALARPQSQMTITTELEARNVPPDLELRGIRTADAASRAVERVEVTLGGRQVLIDSLNPGDVRAFVNLRDRAPGLYTVLLGAENVAVPPGVVVAQITPPRVIVELERRRVRRVPVAPTLAGKVPNGLRREVVVEPANVAIEGPESLLVGLSSVPTDEIDLRDLSPENTPRTFVVGLVLAPAALRLAPGEPQRVRVTVTLRPRAAPPDDGAAPADQTEP
jgi:diadenylate cyclase